MGTYTPNYNLYKPAPTDPTANFTSEYAANMDIIDQNLGGGGGGGGHTIVNPSGSDMPAEGKLQFTGGVTVTDDSVNGKTVVDISGGGGNAYGAFIDTNRIITSGSYSLSLSYTAVEDCFLYTAVALNNNTGGSCAVDGETVSSWWNGSGGTVAEGIGIYLKRGQTFTATATNSLTSGYTVYGLTQGTDNIFTPIIYSETERVVGIWRDNKPLYQITIDLGSDRSFSAVWQSFALKADYPDYDYISAGMLFASSGVGTHVDIAHNDATYLELRPKASAGGRYLTYQYTKATDVAGSGNWNTDGVPTHHYSTNEQVIGTWIDGKPLYQITVEVANPVNDSNEHLVDLTSLSIEECPYLFGYAVRHSGANDITYYANSIETDGWYYFKARYDNFRGSIMYICLFKNDSISRMRFTIQYTKSTD